MFTQPFIQTQIKEKIKAPRHWPLCGEFTGTGEFPAQRASYVENVSIWWRHHGYATALIWLCKLCHYSRYCGNRFAVHSQCFCCTVDRTGFIETGFFKIPWHFPDISLTVLIFPWQKERERLSLSAFLRTEDIGVHIVHISCLIITYTLE